MQQWRVFFLCSTGILTRLRVGEYTNTISSLYSVFYRIFLPNWASYIPAKIHVQAKQHWTQNDITQEITWSVFIHHTSQVASRKK